MRLTGSPSIAVVYLFRHELPAFRRDLFKEHLPHYQRIIPYISRDSDRYPINELRNIAIQQVKTTHFFSSDIDVWPSCFHYLR